MIGIVLATHGKLGSGLLNSAKLILGKQPQLHVLELDETDSLENFRRKMAEAISVSDSGKGVLVLVDLAGGTPANAALLNLRHLPNVKHRAVAGVNLAMLLEALLCRETMGLSALVEAAIQAGMEGITTLDISAN